MSFHMIVNIDGCLDYFPNNKPHRFVTHLQTPLNLRENWKVALVDINLPGHDSAKETDIYLCCNICTGTLVDGIYRSVLRRICLMDTEMDYCSFENLLYLSVIKSEVYDIEFFLTDKHGNTVTLSSEPISLNGSFQVISIFLLIGI